MIQETVQQAKKRILIYGDSNTHGFRVSDGLRFEKAERWTGICQDLVSDFAEILEEGLNGRTTALDEPGMEFRNGFSYIEPCIRTHLPLDLVCVMLGSNDLKAVFAQTPQQIAVNAAAVLVKARWVVQSKYPESHCQYVLMAPIVIGDEMLDGPFSWDFEGTKTIEKSKAFAACYEAEAKENGFLFFDAASAARAGKEDGLHLDPENHSKLGHAFAAWLRTWENGLSVAEHRETW